MKFSVTLKLKNTLQLKMANFQSQNEVRYLYRSSPLCEYNKKSSKLLIIPFNNTSDWLLIYKIFAKAKTISRKSKNISKSSEWDCLIKFIWDFALNMSPLFLSNAILMTTTDCWQITYLVNSKSYFYLSFDWIRFGPPFHLVIKRAKLFDFDFYCIFST